MPSTTPDPRQEARQQHDVRVAIAAWMMVAGIAVFVAHAVAAGIA